MTQDQRNTAAQTTALAAAPWHATGATAVRCGGQCWSYRELEARVAERAAALRREGLAAGELVAVAERPSLDFLVMQHALARCHAALLPVRPLRPPDQLRPLLRLCAAEWRWAATTNGVEQLQPTGMAERTREGCVSDLALVVETSGSTGHPKAVMLTARNIVASALAVNRHLGLGSDDCWLSCLPRRHVGGLSIAYRCALAGAGLLLHEGFDAAAVAMDLERHSVTHLSLVPAMLARLLEIGLAPPPRLRVCLVGGQALSVGLAERALAAGWPLHLTYGMTETASQVATSGRLLALPEHGRVGHILPGVSVTAPPCGTTPAPVAVRGEVVMAGYANPTRTPGLGLEGGWFRTADLGCLSDTGELSILGRADDALSIGGQTVFPAHIEALLAGAPGVSEVVVLGLPDEVWGYRLAAVYTGEAVCTALDGWCRGHLPSHQRPREFRRLAHLPLGPSGKHDRAAIQAWLAQVPASGDDGAFGC